MIAMLDFIKPNVIFYEVQHVIHRKQSAALDTMNSRTVYRRQNNDSCKDIQRHPRTHPRKL